MNDDRITECECSGPGWCQRHQCSKSQHYYDLCRTQPAYFERWEIGRGPGQLKSQPSTNCEFEPIEENGMFECKHCAKRVGPLSGEAEISNVKLRCDSRAKKQAGMGQQLARYSRAVSHWIKAGRPVRSDEQVAEIYSTQCRPCEYLNEKGRCRLCGCRVCDVPDEVSSTLKPIVKLLSGTIMLGMVNKIRMATESCPVNKW